MKSDVEIAQEALLKPISEIGDKLNLPSEALEPYGRFMGKINVNALNLKDKQDGKLILVTAINPTPAGEGKTTTTIGLSDALNLLQKQALVVLREPSLGPVFGVKGGATGGGYAQVVPMENINLHFTGDFHAITSANNLLSALLDNHLHHGNALNIDPKKILWHRVLDMNDRALRQTIVGLGGTADGLTRADQFDITVASEVMAIFCLASDLADLKKRLGNIIVAYNREGQPVYARDLKADGAMTALLKEAFQPNLVQTLGGNPAMIHGGPFANIAHGCNSLIATKSALKLADYVVTEAGFGADLGAEKFCNIKARLGGLKPDCAVIVATVRALKYNGGMKKEALSEPNVEALQKGLPNLLKHIKNLKSAFGLPVVVAINRFTSDSDAELQAIIQACEALGVTVSLCEVWAKGGAGGTDLAEKVLKALETENHFNYLYEDGASIQEKIQMVAEKIYGAKAVNYSSEALAEIKKLEGLGCGDYPICLAKTQYSFSDDPKLLGAPEGFELTVRQVAVANGAGFIVVICGNIMRMPGLPKEPSAHFIDVAENGKITGLF